MDEEQATTLAGSSQERAAADELPVGAIVAGRFEITRRLGQGGAGVVYAARDRLLGEDVALKILHARLRSSADQLEKLRAEVLAARRIAHPNVCRVHDLSESNGLVFVAMELLRGQTLRQRLRQPLGLSEAMDFARQLAAGLGAAHRAGVVHCDVKPENAMLDLGRLVLTDFGVARLLSRERSVEGAAAGAAPGSTAEGTPAYMAPEQVRVRPVDERTDVYGLAAVLFELLSGQPPFGIARKGLLITLFAQILETAPRLRAEPPEGVAEEAWRAVAAALGRGLAKDPAARYESADALVASVAAALGGASGNATLLQEPDAPAAWTGPRAAILDQGSGPLGGVPAGIRPRGARRIATVLHLALAEQVGGDEERAAEAIEALLGAAEIGVGDAGGLVIGRAPRALHAVFGAVASRGDEPERAADVARAVLAAAEGVAVAQARIGVDTGRLLVRAAGPGAPPAVSGDALAIAERLAHAAEPGQAWTSARAARHLRKRFVLDAAGNGALRIGARRPAAELAALAATPLVGRKVELEKLLAELGAAFRDGAPRSALIVGPAGIGKSRLRRELGELLAARGPQIVTVSARPSDTFASHAVVRAVLRDIVTPEAGEAELGGELAALIDDRSTSLALAAAKRALVTAARRRPLLLVIDDAHWADDATLDLVQALARGELEAPIALLTVARPELLERRPQLRAAFRSLLELVPLPVEHGFALAALHLGAGATADQARAIVSAADGNPFFIEELARDVVERGAAAAGALPSTVEDTIQARLDRVTDDEREVLRAASVLGRSFRRRDLQQMLDLANPAISSVVLDVALAGLDERRLVLALPPDTTADDRHAIKHALVRDVVYGELPAAARRALHGAAASLLSARDAAVESGAEHLVELARHLEGAEERERAAVVYRQAGDLSRAKAAFGEAHRCYSRAHILSGTGAAPDLLIALGEAATQVAQLDEAERVLEAALAATAGQGPSAARAYHALSSVSKLRNRWPQAIDQARRGLALIDEREEPVLAARLRCAAGWVLGYILGDNEHGLPEVQGAVALLEGTPHLAELAGAYGALGGNYMRAGRFRDQLDCNRKNLQIGQQIGALDLQARAHVNLGVNLHGLGQLAESIAHTRRALALYERMCATASVALARNNLAFSLLESEPVDLAAAERELVEAIRLSDLCGGLYFRVEADLTGARICARRGDLEAALRHARAGLSRAIEGGGSIDEGISRKVLGALLSRAGDAAGAARELAAALTLLEGSDLGEHARVRAELARAFERSGDLAAARVERAGAREALERLGAAGDLAHLEDLDWI